jgi:magnesium-transporting ATPase (P-type)
MIVADEGDLRGPPASDGTERPATGHRQADAAPPASSTGPDIGTLTAGGAAAELKVDLAVGLSSAEATSRLGLHGPNEVPEEASHPLVRFLKKFWGPSAWMIELVALVSGVLHRFADVALAMGLLVGNAVLSFAQERRASAAVDALRSRLRVSARVMRDGSWRVIPAPELVPGDVIRLRSGDIVPADTKVITGDLTVDQSVLTGESQEVSRTPDGLLFSGSLVRRGEAAALVIRPGAGRFYGRTTQLLKYRDDNPSFMALANGGKPLGRPPYEVELEWRSTLALHRGRILGAQRARAMRARRRGAT